MVAHQGAGGAVARGEERHQGDDAADIERGQSAGEFVAGGADFQEQDCAAWPQNAQRLAQGGADIGDMAQRVAQGDEIGACGGERQRLGRGLDERDLQAGAGDGEHGFANVEADDGVLVAGEVDHLAGEQAGADGDIHRLHARPQAGPVQAGAAVPAAGAKRENPVGEVVMAGGVVEHAADEIFAACGVGVIGGVEIRR